MPDRKTTSTTAAGSAAPQTGGSKNGHAKEQTQPLRITEVRLHEHAMLCRLSDGRWLNVPLSVSGAVASAPPVARFQWRLSGDGKAVFWYTEALKAHLSLREMLSFPESELRETAGD